ncbi:MAG: malonic semialdehyde reductase [Luteibacter sp.]|uniref:malonic semialdehyde reductase n=1 Tax=Luteibacter TaxID=242605 RepID=UPI00055C0E44|nr:MULTISPECIES: malonic semialdehyde reductase [unclassified Luteibacter]MDQ7997365.1 malonic semialdehyde reductase [Luteibacter sp.]MDQ8050452.1 malonic semialdehyde reductase [Luteibacter sp.]MDR6643631.1 3-hydroxypropanoate dehydrogenase [Luteibacter sp. 1214]
MSAPLSDASLDQLFLTARTYNAWLPKEVTDEQIHRLYELAKFGPTAANSSPMRVIFIKSQDAKARLKPYLAENNAEKTMSAPVTAIVATDFAFYEHLPKLFPHADARSWFVGNEDLIQSSGSRNGSLQGAYLIMAARALGLDCGPMSGFDQAGVDAEFFAGSQVKSNFLINIGYGDPDKNLFGRLPRLDFDEAAQIA